MGTIYTKEEVLKKLQASNSIDSLYNGKENEDIINKTGITKDTKEKYTEVVAKELLDNPSRYDFDKISIIHRESNYNTDSHDGSININSNRREENIAKMMFKKEYSDLGKILDYQVPLKNKTEDPAGKIDLISHNDSNNTLYLIELKNDSSNETLLRCALEIVTYSKKVDGEKLLKDFELDKNVLIKPAILIFENTKPFENINDYYVGKLLEKYNVDVFIANSDKTQEEERFTITKYTHEQS